MNAYKDICQRIANRGNFQSAPLRDVEGFAQYPESPQAAALRTFLGLNNGSTDFYVRAIAGALLSSHDLIQGTGAPIRLTDISIALSLLPVNRGIHSMDNDTKVVAGTSDPTGLVRLSASWPISCDIVLRRIDPTVANYENAGRTTRIPAHLYGNTLRPQWPAETGLTAHVEMTDAGTQWTDGSVLRFTDEPEHYPYAAMLTALEPKSHWLQLLTTHGLAGHYAGAVSQPLARTGLLAAALMLDTRRIA